MTTRRTGAAATLLADGRVLVVGGSGPRTSSPNQTSAELYNPKTGTFSATGSMTTARIRRPRPCSPTAASWSPGAPAPTVRGSPRPSCMTRRPARSAHRLDDCRALPPDRNPPVRRPGPGRRRLRQRRHDTGGYTNTIVASLASAELYDPKTGAFTVTGSMSTPRAAHAATLLPDGRVLVAGGFRKHSGGQTLASTDLYDPKTGTFSATGP